MSFTIDTVWGNLKSDGAVHPSPIPASENRRTAQRRPPSGFLVAQKAFLGLATLRGSLPRHPPLGSQQPRHSAFQRALTTPGKSCLPRPIQRRLDPLLTAQRSLRAPRPPSP